jgi:hypothetical protein
MNQRFTSGCVRLSGKKTILALREEREERVQLGYAMPPDGYE